MLNPLKKFFDPNKKELNKHWKTVEKINNLEPQTQQLSYEDMQKRIAEMKGELEPLVAKVPQEDKESLQRVDYSQLPQYEIDIRNKLLEFMPEVFAMIREVFRRELNRRHYDVQLLSAVILANGQKLVEVKTGEGKTQIFPLPLMLYALAGRGAHLVTVNEYLAKRDAEYIGFIADKLGLRIGVVSPGQVSYKYINDEEVKERKGEDIYQELQNPDSRRLPAMQGYSLKQCTKQAAYACDITYGVNNEFGFDYLRDNMATQLPELSQRELYFCLVDEADSILIDEARTPLIISAIPEESDSAKYKEYARVAKKLVENEDYEIDHKTRTVMFTEQGIDKAEKALGTNDIWSDYGAAHHLENALKAKALFHKDDHYIIQNGEVLIVDQFTGRVMPGRRFSEGIHQAIEAKEGVQIQKESKTYANITFQNYFRLYKFLGGGSGTIMTEAEEFSKIYQLDSVAVPTNEPVIREDKADAIYRSQDIKFKAVAQEVAELHAKGQPVLIGTTSVEKSEQISAYLDELEIPHNVLNAKYHEREAQIVSKAGERGAVTVATNMAGRGTDIPLGEGVRELGGLAVIGTERHEARRIDNQLRGRSGRQGDPGYSRFYVALDDQIMRVLGGEMMDKLVGRFMDNDAPIELKMISKQIEGAQKRVEGMNFDTRKNLVDYDDVMNKQREIFYTRRRQILRMADNARGYFETKNLNTEDIEKRKQNAQQETETMTKDLMNREVDYIVDSQAQGEKKIQEEQQVENIVNHILDLAPDDNLAHAFSIAVTELQFELQNQIRGRQTESTRNFIEEPIMQLTDNKIEEIGRQDLPSVVKMLILDGMNNLWMEHLETMTDIRSGINLQAYAQRDPLVEYKTQAFRQFEELMHRIDSNFARRFLKITRVQNQPQPVQQNFNTNVEAVKDIDSGDREMLTSEKGNNDQMLKQAKNRSSNLQQQAQNTSGKKQTIVNENKVGRNEPCPCGSGKKYKNCGLKNTAEHQQNMQNKG